MQRASSFGCPCVARVCSRPRAGCSTAFPKPAHGHRCPGALTIVRCGRPSLYNRLISVDPARVHWPPWIYLFSVDFLPGIVWDGLSRRHSVLPERGPMPRSPGRNRQCVSPAGSDDVFLLGAEIGKPAARIIAQKQRSRSESSQPLQARRRGMAQAVKGVLARNTVAPLVKCVAEVVAAVRAARRYRGDAAGDAAQLGADLALVAERGLVSGPELLRADRQRQAAGASACVRVCGNTGSGGRRTCRNSLARAAVRDATCSSLTAFCLRRRSASMSNMLSAGRHAARSISRCVKAASSGLTADWSAARSATILADQQPRRVGYRSRWPMGAHQ